MTSQEIREKFLAFFEARGHKRVASSSLIPDDPSVLLTTAGMQQFKKYYTSEADPIKDFGMSNTVSIQKSFRTSDIDEVGDESHLTFFEMLGNFSFGYKPGEPDSPKGGYFKKEAIQYAYDFIVKEMSLEISYVTIFKGSPVVSKDTESETIWKSLGMSDVREEGMEDVFWGPTGFSGPCGPTTEIYCKNANGQDVEIWNIVFNEFLCNDSREQLLRGNATLTPLEKKGIDTGMGLERLVMISQNKKNIFETDLFDAIMRQFPDSLSARRKRIIVDHTRAIVFLICDGLRPSNKGAGYILRRLMRRVIAFAYSDNIGKSPEYWMELVIDKYKSFSDYHSLDFTTVKDVFDEEYQKSLRTFEFGRREVEKEANRIKANNQNMLPHSFVFNLHQSAGVTIDVLSDFAEKENVQIDRKAFMKDMECHQKLSRAGLEKKFGGHGLLLDTGELKAADEKELKIVTRLHTATHLLQAALRNVLGAEVRQQGSDITAQRTRFDFSFSRKLTPEEIRQVEDTVNQAIERDYAVEYKEMPYEDAITSGALHFFREKYPMIVKVYSVFDPKTGEIFSREFCGGPHVVHTGEIGRIHIIKEESSAAGIRRIRAVVSE